MGHLDQFPPDILRGSRGFFGSSLEKRECCGV